MTLSAAEQYMLELMNRARLNPAAECARFGIDINKDLPAGTLNTSVKQALAPNALLETAATNHSLWMLANDIFSHTGAGGTDPGQREVAAGYRPSAWGENIAWYGSTAVVTVESAIATLNQNLFLSAVHRENLMNNTYREVGLGAEAGQFKIGSINYNSAIVTQDFGTSGTTRFLTGVSYIDRDGDNFYSMGEGRNAVGITAAGHSTTTAAAGGYSVLAGTSSTTLVSGNVGTRTFQATVDMSRGNVKLDIVDDAQGTKFMSSGNITVGFGIRNVQLLGAAGLAAIGNSGDNILTGNDGNNRLAGAIGHDNLSGGKGADTLLGGPGTDTLFGGGDNDVLTGGSAADTFVFGSGSGSDRITDFHRLEGDTLSIDNSLWTGTKTAAEVVSQFAHVVGTEVVFDFGGGAQIHLVGLTSLTGLDSTLHIF